MMGEGDGELSVKEFNPSHVGERVEKFQAGKYDGGR